MQRLSQSVTIQPPLATEALHHPKSAYLGCSCRLDDLTNDIDDDLRLIDVDVMAAVFN